MILLFRGPMLVFQGHANLRFQFPQKLLAFSLLLPKLPLRSFREPNPKSQRLCRFFILLANGSKVGISPK